MDPAMDRPKFLFDEDVSRVLAHALRSHEPAMDIVCVGEPAAPKKETPDPELLDIAEATSRILVSNDKKTMRRHLIDHFA
jgi:predicted nuclease of predicted toxin-antitoxin system